MTYGMKKAEAGLEIMDEGYKKIAVAEKILFAIGSRYHMGASLMAKTYPKFAEGLNKYGEGTTKFNAAAEKFSQGGRADAGKIYQFIVQSDCSQSS